MASLSAKKTISNLKKKGFSEGESSHHLYLEFWHNNILIATTYCSHNGQDIGDNLITAMRKQCKMDKDFFIAFAKCTKTQQDYISLLINDGEI